MSTRSTSLTPPVPVLSRDCDDNVMYLEDINLPLSTFCRLYSGTVLIVWYFCFSLLSSIGIKVNVACVKVDEGCIQHAFCNSSSICQCSKGYSYKGGACKYLKSIYLYYFVGIKEKEIQCSISLICNTIINAISSYIVVVGHNLL
jgi:hypothetical protein